MPPLRAYHSLQDCALEILTVRTLLSEPTDVSGRLQAPSGYWWWQASATAPALSTAWPCPRWSPCAA